MKLSKLILFLFLLTVFKAGISEELAKGTVSGNYQNVTLRSVLIEWEEKLNLKFCYFDELIHDKRVTAKFVNEKLKDALEIILLPSKIAFKMNDDSRTIILYSATHKESAYFGELRGLVTDKSTRAPMPGVNVIIEGTTYGTATDLEGRFRLRLPVSMYTVSFQMISHEKKVVPDVLIRSKKITSISVQLNEKVLELSGGLVATAFSYFEKDPVAPVSVRSLTYEEIRRAPGAREDICRMVQTMPGAAPATDANRNDLIVRGGSPSEVLYRIDNIDIPNPNHFATQGAGGGVISILNTQFIQEVDFLSGAFPAQYGGKLSAVLDIKYREGSPHKLGGILDLSYGGAGVNLEGPIHGGKGSWLFAFHRSYLELLESIIDINGVPVYTNYQGKVVYNFSRGIKLSVIGIGGDDHIEMDGKPSSDKNDYRAGWRYTRDYDFTISKNNQFTLGANLSKIWNSKLYSNFTVSHSFNRFDIDNNEKTYRITRSQSGEDLNIDMLSLKHQYDNISKERFYDIKTDWSFIPTAQNEIQMGAFSRWVQYDHNINYFPLDSLNNEGIIEKPMSDSMHQEGTPKVGLYVNYRHNFGPRFSLNAGVRYEYFELLKTNDVSPRLSATYRLNERLSLNLGTGLYYQSPELVHITSSSEQLDRLKSIACEHYIVGIDYLVGEGTLFSAEVFRKNYTNYPVASDPDYSHYSAANTGDQHGSVWGYELTSEGEGFAHGIELLLQKKLITGLHGLMSYSYSVTKHKALDGIFRPGAFDNRHVFNLILGYRANKALEFSLKWRYAGGRPYTPYDIVQSMQQNHNLLDMTRINAERLGAYHRLDLRFDHRTYYKHFTLVSYFSIENAYYHKNPFGINSSNQFNYQNEFLPIGGFSLEF